MCFVFQQSRADTCCKDAWQHGLKKIAMNAADDKVCAEACASCRNQKIVEDSILFLRDCAAGYREKKACDIIFASHKFFWRARRDSNAGPLAPEANALSS